MTKEETHLNLIQKYEEKKKYEMKSIALESPAIEKCQCNETGFYHIIKI